jgi:MFS family permease
VRVLKTKASWAEHSELAVLFFLQMMALGIWLVPLSRILNAHGLNRLPPYAYATTALASFISPLVFGAMADRHASPVRVLRWLAVASAAGTILAGWSIEHGWPPALVLAFIQLYAITAVPTSSLASTIVFSRLRDSQKQFGPVRAVGTFGWMCGCWLISAFSLDSSPSATRVGALVWIALAVFTCFLPALPLPASRPMTFRERMGWDALVLLKHHDHRVVFITVALFSIPLAALYPFTPIHLQQLGFQRTSSWMSLGQVTEIIALFCLAGIFTRWRLKWIFAAGLLIGALRYALCALNQKPWLLAGVTLHGFSFVLVFITAQIYLNERVEPAWRARAQALMSLMTGGVGNLIGYLGTGFWFLACARPGGTRWSLFWGFLSLAIAAVLLFFLIAYRGRTTGFRREPKPTDNFTQT